MKIAIVGSSGFISSFLLNQFSLKKEWITIGPEQNNDFRLDLNCANEFDYNQLCGIDYVIFTAAISSPDQCAINFDTSWKVNVIGTKYFIEEAIKRNCNILFFSSDAIFGDLPGEIYTENSATKATTSYGKMKKSVEDYFQGNPHFKSIRLSYVVSNSDRFVKYCISCIQQNKIAEVFHPFYRNCITIHDIMNVVNWFLVHWNEYDPPVLNLAGQELVSRVRIADEINRILGNSLSYRVVTPNQNFYRNRPCITQMKSIYISEYKILKSESFSEKFKKEFEGVI